MNQYVRLQNIFDIVTETDEAEIDGAARKLTLLMRLPLTLQPNQTVSVCRCVSDRCVIGAVLCYGVNVRYFCRSPSQHYFLLTTEEHNIHAAKIDSYAMASLCHWLWLWHM